MIVQRITLHLIELMLKSPFTTSNGSYLERKTVLVEAEDHTGQTGWGECVAFATPWYTEETIGTAWHMMDEFLIPALLGKQIRHPSEIRSLFAHVRRNQMAKAGLETAVWDLYSKLLGIPLAQAIGGERREVEAGVAIGLPSSEKELFHTIDRYLQDGYRRMKVKIKPGRDVGLIQSIRRQFPDLQLMADANSAYTLQDADHLQRLDAYHLLMLEQPLGADDIVDHAKLQARLTTPVCLDESIVTCEDARKALALGSCKVINIKIGRVGGLSEAVNMHQLCAGNGIPVWCGGMLETGVGRAHNLALASLPHFTIPGDLSASSRYWERDIIAPEITVRDGKIQLPNRPGIGFEIDREFLQSVTQRTQTYHS